ncbi:MAG: 50S ribosomal protein L3 [Candidatus Zixiibacteriota bacterium]
MRELLGRKLGMTRVFPEGGEAIPVTVIEAGPNVVVGLRTVEKDGYAAAQIGFGEKREGLFNKPELGHYKKSGVAPHRTLKEVSFDGELKVGDTLTAELFKEGEVVDVSGMSKGLGFQGVMRRHGFSGGQQTHGQSDRLRAPGSIGQSSTPSRVFKGIRMGGRMGGERVTAIGLDVIRVVPEKNLVLVRGTVPGKKGSLVRIRKSTRG